METPDTPATEPPPTAPADAVDVVDVVDVPDVPDVPDALDLDAVERDLAGVEVALERLDAGTYWTDELDGSPIPDAVLEHDPIARRAR